MTAGGRSCSSALTLPPIPPAWTLPLGRPAQHPTITSGRRLDRARPGFPIWRSPIGLSSMQPVDACRPAAPPRDCNCYAVRSDEKRLGRSELAPARLGGMHQLELDGCDSEEANDGRLPCVLLDPVVLRGPSDAPE